MGPNQFEAVEGPFARRVAAALAPVVEDADRRWPDRRFFGFGLAVAFEVDAARPPGPHVAFGADQLVGDLAHQVAEAADPLAGRGVDHDEVGEGLVGLGDGAKSARLGRQIWPAAVVRYTDRCVSLASQRFVPRILSERCNRRRPAAPLASPSEKFGTA